jgi:hypothetical protein
VSVTEQLPEDNVQLAPTVTIPVFDDVKLTVPVGVLDGVVVSATVAMQLEVPPMLTVLGLHDTVVVVLSLPTLIVPEVPELVL